MNLKYRIVKDSNGKFEPEYFEGIWIFGTWKSFGRHYKKLKAAEQYILYYANMVLATNKQTIKEITIK